MHRLAKYPKIVDLGLQRITQLNKTLGNTIFLSNIVHIAGTNGKGSTSAFIESILLAHKKSVNRFTSPHLINWNERIKINGQDITDAELTKYLDLIETVTKVGSLGFFEIITTAAILAFNNNKSEFNILEVGMGGIFDATNVVGGKKIAVITPISLDHQERLGSNVMEIAKNKLGIIKRGDIVFSAMQDSSVISEMFSLCKKNNNKLFIEGVDWFVLDDLDLYMRAEYQKQNASLALVVAKHLLGDNFQEKIAIEALNNTSWSGRWEDLTNSYLHKYLPRAKNIFIEGAHNIAGFSELQKELCKFGDKTLVISLLNNRNVREILSCLDINDNIQIICVSLDDTKFHTAEHLKDISLSLGFKNVELAKDIIEAIDKAANAETVIFTGSLYFIAEVLRLSKQVN